jgi:two-component system, cell cycle sensor histidine kinase and response regulator CckA
MPEMSGRDLAQQLTIRRPDTKVLFMSGYTDHAVAHRGVLDPEMEFLQKPFTAATLTRKVREILDVLGVK